MAHAMDFLQTESLTTSVRTLPTVTGTRGTSPTLSFAQTLALSSLSTILLLNVLAWSLFFLYYRTPSAAGHLQAGPRDKYFQLVDHYNISFTSPTRLNMVQLTTKNRDAPTLPPANLEPTEMMKLNAPVKVDKPEEPAKPAEPQMTHEEIRAVLKGLRTRNRSDVTWHNDYEPADGRDTAARRLLFLLDRYKLYKRRMWYRLHKNALRTVKPPQASAPIYSLVSKNQAESFRIHYIRCMANGFYTDPWASRTVKEYFDNRPCPADKTPQPRAGVRAGWSFERGFEKEYRTEPTWVNINFDEIDVAPEEIWPGQIAQKWVDSYLERNPHKSAHIESLYAGRLVPSTEPSPAHSTIYSPDLDSQKSMSKRWSRWLPKSRNTKKRLSTILSRSSSVQAPSDVPHPNVGDSAGYLSTELYTFGSPFNDGEENGLRPSSICAALRAVTVEDTSTETSSNNGHWK